MAVPTTPEALATHPGLVGEWRDDLDRDLLQALTAQVGREEAGRLWGEACNLYDRLHAPADDDADIARLRADLQAAVDAASAALDDPSNSSQAIAERLICRVRDAIA